MIKDNVILTSILENIDDMRHSSEIDVLISIGESYSKILSIMEGNDCVDIDVVMESFMIFAESNDTNKDSSVLSNIKTLFSKVINYIKSTFKKLGDIFKRKFTSNQKNVYTVSNILKIIDQLENAKQPNKPANVNEYTTDDIDENVYQEGIADTISKAKRSHDQKEMAKKIRKQLRKDINAKYLTNKEVRQIVESVTNELSKEEFKKLQAAIKAFKKEQFPSFEEGVIRNLTMIITTANSMNSMRKKTDEMMKPGYFGKISDQKKVNIDTTVQNNIDKKLNRDILAKVDKDLKLVQKFAETLGASLNNISKRDNFSYQNCKRIVYGGHPIKYGFVATADCLINIIKRASIITPQLSSYGNALYDAHHAFADYVELDEETRKDMNIKLNKTVKMLLFALDSIKEETYGWEDDPFNRESYGNFNMFTMGAGGPFTVMTNIIMLALTKDPTYVAFQDAAGIGGVVGMYVANKLKPTPRK